MNPTYGNSALHVRHSAIISSLMPVLVRFSALKVTAPVPMRSRVTSSLLSLPRPVSIFMRPGASLHLKAVLHACGSSAGKLALAWSW